MPSLKLLVVYGLQQLYFGLKSVSFHGTGLDKVKTMLSELRIANRERYKHAMRCKQWKETKQDMKIMYFLLCGFQPFTPSILCFAEIIINLIFALPVAICWESTENREKVHSSMRRRWMRLQLKLNWIQLKRFPFRWSVKPWKVAKPVISRIGAEC